MGTGYIRIAIFIWFCCFHFGKTADPVLSWTTWTDSAGNTANENSDVTWAQIPLPANTSYKLGAINYDSRGLEPLYNFAKAFINGAVFPYGVSWGVIDKILNGTLINDVTENYLDYVKEFAGYGALIVIGFLFLIIFPFIGMCFCCCRCCCNNCGGAMKQNPKDANNHCKRRTFAVILFVLIAFIVAGMICVYISNDQMTDTVATFDSTASNALDDLESFVDIFIFQLKHVALVNFNFTRDVIYRDLDSIGYIVGRPVRSTLKANGGVDTAIDSAFDLASKVDTIAIALIELNTSITYVRNNATSLESAVNATKNEISNDTDSCGNSCSGAPNVSTLIVSIDANSFPNISNQIDTISSVQSHNLTGVVVDAKQEFEDIPWTVENETKTEVADIKNTVNDLSDKIQPIIDQADSFKNDTTGSFSITTYKDLLRNYTKYGVEYDEYRWYGGIGLSSVILLIVLLLLIGLMFAVFGHSTDVDPTERSCLSSCGGHMFMAAVGFVFMFSSFLMLLTTVVFILGTPMHRFVCEPITDPDLTDFQTILDTYVYRSMYGGTGSLFGKLLLQNSSHSLSLKKILRDCEVGKSAYAAFELSNIIDISALTNYSGTLNVESQLDNIDVDLSNLEILTPDLTAQLNDLKLSADINFTEFREKLAQDSLEINLTSLASELRDFASNISAVLPDYSKKFYTHANRTDSINDNELADFIKSMADLESKLDVLEAAVNGTSDNVENTLLAFNNTQTYLQNNGSQAVKDEAKIYADRLLKVVDSLVNNTLDALENEIGVCTPVWNLYNDILVISFCKYLVDTLNGFWFGVGWCVFFFIPSIIFATKLAKHYRKMKIHKCKDVEDKRSLPLPEVDTRHSPGLKKNKVAHSDGKDSLTSW
ncbi:prominin-1-like isoform X2 [Mytilus californianus]|uniref:prominin-1-like isoform X1 n=1 Tax=Mytilus californianus TaxID=6549 RepID=UPI002246F966|nr:prominin-1-like isoform X1 [Mytilus californianus]XP_052098378.1 prominin-1-like isoform X2 [Mytilus californianus]